MLKVFKVSINILLILFLPSLNYYDYVIRRVFDVKEMDIRK